MNSLINVRRAKSGRRVVRIRAKTETTNARGGMIDNRVYVFVFEHQSIIQGKVVALRNGGKTYSQLLSRGGTGNIHYSREEHHSTDDVEATSIGVVRR